MTPARHYKNMQVQVAVNGTKKNKYYQRNKKNKPRVASEDGLPLLYLQLASYLFILFNLFRVLTLFSNRSIIFLTKK
ncbi:hypothetical protein AOLE_10520 [Acinetobacter oleivorans DR1]|uniref:Uncharacterized protein n=1 Tax=Acinetobacter oleivorans (strain JCM 16667 / KCTC 23045 / DR1) TaxID=436717 RepID=A0AAN0UDE8_ACISD|nr:hypothetical protein AOLE_10520 [Acinetobacter oleivorans DR1]